MGQVTVGKRRDSAQTQAGVIRFFSAPMKKNLKSLVRHGVRGQRRIHDNAHKPTGSNPRRPLHSGGAPAKSSRAARGGRKIGFKFRVPARQQLLILNFPAVRRHLEFMRRIAILNAAFPMLASGHFSLRTAAAALGLAPSQLCGWLQNYRSHGAEGLRPKPRQNQRRQNARELCELSILVGGGVGLHI